MLERIRGRYEHTIYACYIGYITQAVINNFAPLLFLTFQKSYKLSLEQITFLMTMNFMVQLLVDLVSARLVDRIGYRISVVTAHIFSAAGLAGLAVLPELFHKPYQGLTAAVVCYAIGGGMIEVLISPIVEACPTKKKEAAMSLLHSFYCWGHVLVVLVSTAFFAVAGLSRWKLLAGIWALVPILNLFYFSQVPLYKIAEEHEGMSIRVLLKQKIFWLLMLLMVCAGAAEQAMSQWSSAFAEAGLHVSKAAGDLAGPCAFALCMGTARLLYGKYSEKLPMKKAMIGSAVLCTGCYLLAALAQGPVPGLVGCALCGFSVGIFWPGTFSTAAKRLPAGGTALFAFMALAGDLGCSFGPALVGMAAGAEGGRLGAGLLAAVVFPVVMLAGLSFLKEQRNQRDQSASEAPEKLRSINSI